MKRVSERRFRWILKLLPGSFREEHERELLLVWRDESREASRQQQRRVFMDALRDTLSVAPREYVVAAHRNLGVAIKRLRRAPAFTLTAIATLALGTGATASVFGLLNSVILRPLPWRSPERVGLVWATQPSGARTWLSFEEFEWAQRDIPSFASVAGMMDLRLHYAHDDSGDEVQALAISHDFLTTLGVAPAIGRDFAREDDRPTAARVVLLSDAFWRSRFGGDRSVLGRSMKLGGQDYAIIGILPPSFELLPASSVLPDRVDVWLPLEPHAPSREGTVRYLHVLARLRSDATFTQAETELRALAVQRSRQFPALYPGGPWTFDVVSFKADVLGGVQTALLLLFGLVLLVLVMACANVANLLVARGEARQAELAIRTALGAGPARLAGELLTEAALLASAGTVLGFGLAVAVPKILQAIDPGALPRLSGGLDLRMGTFMFGLLLLTVLLFASVPLIERLRLRDISALSIGRSGGRTKRSARLAQALVIVQTALATTIFVTTLFLTDTLIRLQKVDLGFVPDDVVSGRVTLSPQYTAGTVTAQFYDQSIEALRQAPGIVGAAAITQLPLSGALLGSTFLVTPEPEPRRVDADLRGITSDYFGVMRIPLLAGRGFSDQDRADTPGVAIVDEAFARRIGRDGFGPVVGRRIRWFRQPNTELEIVGIVKSVRHRGPDQPPQETVYRPHRQYSRSSMFLVIRSHQDTASAAVSMRAALARVDRFQALADVMTMKERAGHSIARARTSLFLASTLAGLAIVLGCVGLYGVLSVGVAQRRREFGVRMALGAPASSVRRLVVAEGMALSVIGAALGVFASAVVVNLVRSTLYEASVGRPVLYALGSLAVLVCSTLAFWLPARRASAVNPIETLQAP